MQVYYNTEHDLLYLRLDGRQQEVRNHDAGEGIVLDLGESDHIVGIEILDASRRIDLSSLLPVEFQAATR